MDMSDDTIRGYGSHPVVVWVFLFILFRAILPGQVIKVKQPRIHSVPPSHVFRAGAAEIDVTPLPGFPIFGYSWGAAKRATGYWTRLKSRAIVFENANGKRVAMVQVDLGAMSGLLHREVAKRLAAEGLGPGDIMIAASHTHGGPGGFFGYAFYNIYGSGRQGFFYHLVEWLADRIAQSVKEACKDLAPAVVGAGEITVEGLSQNRSMGAWEKNFPDNNQSLPYNGIISSITVIRVDHIYKGQSRFTLPIAVFVVAPVHSTAAGFTSKLYHGDLFGAASRYLTGFIGTENGNSRPVVAAVVPGPQGDVSPSWKKHEFEEARRLGHLLAIHALRVFSDLKEKLCSIEVKNVYKEISVPGAPTSAGPLCKKPKVGSPVLGGTEDLRSFLYGKLGGREGVRRKKPRGCHGYKKPAVGILHGLLVHPSYVPSVAPLQVIQLGRVITIAMIPAEPTTETGRRICESIREVVHTEYVVLIALANEYMSYVATREEYSAQHFEGAFTLYGPNEARFFLENLVQLAQVCGTKDAYSIPDKRIFSPGWGQRLLRGRKKNCNPHKWRSIRTSVKRKENGRLLEVRFEWRGLKKKRLIRQLPHVRVICKNGSGGYPQGIVDTDDGLNFYVFRKGRSLWTVIWIPPEGIKGDGILHITVDRPEMEPLCSEEFTLDN